MARRRRLDPPTSDIDLVRARAAEALGGRPSFDLVAAPPIAKIAAESVSAHSAEIERLKAEAEAGKAAREELDAAAQHGLLIVKVPLNEIDIDYLARDRILQIDERDDEWSALKSSILAHGQRTPVDLAPLSGDGPRKYGLISGYRRIQVLRHLHADSGHPRWATVRAVVRTPSTLGQAFVSMVEENEIRQSLSYYERARVCLLSAEQGAFDDPDAALDALFSAASKAKRSKIRSFMTLVEEIGDLLTYPQAIGERLGLRLARMLRAGAASELRRHVVRHPGPAPDAAAEVAWLAAFAMQSQQRRPASGPAQWVLVDQREDGVVEYRRDSQGVMLRLRGRDLDDAALRKIADIALAARR